MEGKKISFGFLKTKKQDKPSLSETKEYIDCLEEKSIKVVGGDTVEEMKPLVIPMKANTLITAERLKAIAEKVENFDEPIIVKQEKEEDPPDNESLDQMAVRELMEGAKKIKVEVKEELVVPINVKPVIDGQAEATLDDYESVPIQDFGLAMLRGMGWTESKEQSKYKQPTLRPKGLGLGADKVIKDNQKNKSGKDEELSIVKNSFVKITSGKHSGYYGKVVSLDEENGRVMVDIIMKKETVSLSEFMMEAVTKSEFDKQSKVINSESYEKYKKNEKLEHIQRPAKTNERREVNESSSSKTSKEKEHSQRDYRTEQRQEDNRRNDKYSNGSRRSRSRESLDKRKDRYRRESSSSEEDRSRHRKKNKKKYSSNESLSSDSDKRKVSVSRRRSSSDSSEENYRKKNKSKSKVKRDIDKKRKGKKKRRDRDRSPNYKKHRK